MSQLLKPAGVVMVGLLSLTIVACGGGGGEADQAAPEEEAAEAAAPVVSPEEAATLTGTIAFSGTAPAGEAIDMSEEPACADKHAESPQKRAVVVNDNGTLANVYVYIKEGLPALDFPVSPEGVTLDQDGCLYRPHVVAIQTGQDFVIRNSDGILHNINTRPVENQGFNISQPVEMETTRTFAVPEVMIPVRCDVHGWMQAFIGVQDHPYAAVTGGDGTFTLDNLPPGDYVVEAWHELYGTQTANITVGAQETQQITFNYSSDMAGRDVPMGEPIDLHDHRQVAVGSTGD